jgi:hypothetical protein
MGEQNDTAGSRIDLSSVPEPMRSLLLKQLARFPAPMREQLLREGSPLLDRAIARARERAAATTAALPAASARSEPVRVGADRIQTVRHGSGAVPARIQTVSPGDRTSGGAWLFVFGIALIVAGYLALRG